jgi:hypothetical protein
VAHVIWLVKWPNSRPWMVKMTLGKSLKNEEHISWNWIWWQREDMLRFCKSRFPAKGCDVLCGWSPDSSHQRSKASYHVLHWHINRPRNWLIIKLILSRMNMY